MLFVALALAKSDQPWADAMRSCLWRFWWLLAIFGGAVLFILVELASSGHRVAYEFHLGWLDGLDLKFEFEPTAPAAVLEETTAAGRRSEGFALHMSTDAPREVEAPTTAPPAVVALLEPRTGTSTTSPGVPTQHGTLSLSDVEPTASAESVGTVAPTLSAASTTVPTSIAASAAALASAGGDDALRLEWDGGLATMRAALASTGGDEGLATMDSEAAGASASTAAPSGPPVIAASAAVAKSPFCNLGVCRLHGAQAPRLFVAEHTDGAGHRMANIINGIAVAAHNRMNFGGVVAVPNNVTEQGHDFRGLADRFFGSQDAAKQLFFRSARVKTRSAAYFALPPCPDFDAEFKKLRDMESSRPSFKDSANVYVPAVAGVSVPKYFAPELLSALRRPLAARPLQFAAGRPAVALHVRRGDLKTSDARATADEYYYRVVERIRALLPDADVHAWSSTQNIMAFGNKRLWSEKDFDGYRERNITVHLDDGDLLDPWAHLSRAHVLVMSMSSFSYVPAVLNPHCVIYAGSMSGRAAPTWADGFNEKRKSYDADLEACVRKGYGGAPPPALRGTSP